MASAGAIPASDVAKPSGNSGFADKLPDEINEMKIRDEKAEKVGSSFKVSISYLLFIYCFHLFFG